MEPRVIEQLFRRASLFGFPPDHPAHEVDEHPFLFSANVGKRAFKAEVFRYKVFVFQNP